MSERARGWVDALLAIGLYFALSAALDPAQAATHERVHQETNIMAIAHSEGPFRAIAASPTGYTTIHDPNGRIIGAALTGNDCHSRGLPKEKVEANGRLFAASSTLYKALTRYMAATEVAVQRGEFTEHILQELDKAHEEAVRAFDIIEQGQPS